MAQIDVPVFLLELPSRITLAYKQARRNWSPSNYRGPHALKKPSCTFHSVYVFKALSNCELRPNFTELDAHLDRIKRVRDEGTNHTSTYSRHDIDLGSTPLSRICFTLIYHCSIIILLLYSF